MALDLSQYSTEQLQGFLDELKTKKSEGSSSEPPALSDTRVRFGKELESNPDLSRKLLASVQAEVGDQGEDAKQAYLESVMNRAAARGMTLDETISDKSYYPSTTLSRLNREISSDVRKSLNPIVNRVLSGSNVANFATGNESGNVRSGNAPITFNPRTGERFVLENADKQWIHKVGGSDVDFSGNTIEEPEDLATWKLPEDRNKVTQDDINKAARYRAIQMAKGYQEAGAPLTASEFKKLVSGQFAAIEKEISPAELQRIPGEQLEGLSVYSSNYDTLAQLQKLHAAAVDKGAPGFGSWTEAGLGPLSSTAQATSQEGIAFNTAVESALSNIARGVGGQVGVLTDKDLEIVRNYMPKPGDSKTTVATKIDTLKQQIQSMLGRKLEFYKAEGYNTTGLEKIYKSMLADDAKENAKSASAPGDDEAQKKNAHLLAIKQLDEKTSKNKGTAQASPSIGGVNAPPSGPVWTGQTGQELLQPQNITPSGPAYPEAPMPTTNLLQPFTQQAGSIFQSGGQKAKGALKWFQQLFPENWPSSTPGGELPRD